MPTTAKSYQSTATFRVITVKFPKLCTETRKRIGVGEIALYNPSSKKLWCAESKKYQSFINSPK